MTKGEYQEGKVCPQGNGAYVDIWKIGKYRQGSEMKLERYQELMKKGLLTINEVRKREGLPGIPDGNKLFVPLTNDHIK
ncbi:hypothetical protein [Neobacillus sp.]|uniref:hypothetical protein n=1 Tax=Neobacillus sp. TaxID=2675273 RepID=UPI00289DDDFC|nr:hypothetical protein [Neobacillus sp.]